MIDEPFHLTFLRDHPALLGLMEESFTTDEGLDRTVYETLEHVEDDPETMRALALYGLMHLEADVLVGAKDLQDEMDARSIAEEWRT